MVCPFPCLSLCGFAGLSIRDYLIQSFDDLRKFFCRDLPDALPNSFSRQGPDLTYLDPRLLGLNFALQLKCKRKASSLGLACDCHRDDSARPFIEYIVTQYQNRPCSGLLMSPYGI